MALGTADGGAGRRAGEAARGAGFRAGARFGAALFLDALFFRGADRAAFLAAGFREVFLRAGMEPSLFESYRRLPVCAPAGAVPRRAAPSNRPCR